MSPDDAADAWGHGAAAEQARGALAEALASCSDELGALERREHGAAGEAQRRTEARLADALNVVYDAAGDLDIAGLDALVGLLERARELVQRWRFGTIPSAQLVECARAVRSAIAALRDDGESS